MEKSMPGNQCVADQREGKRAEYLLVIYPGRSLTNPGVESINPRVDLINPGVESINPGVDLQEKLLEEQRQFARDYRLPVRVLNKPHVSLAVFQAGDVIEDMLIRWIRRICDCYTSFDLTFNNYSGFPPHTIYLRVQDPLPFRMLMQQLRAIDEFIRSSGCPPAHLFTRPFLTIAGGLTEQVYNKALPDYSRRTFHETFHVDELVLLKRAHPFDDCRTVNIFRLRQPEAEPLSRWPLPHI